MHALICVLTNPFANCKLKEFVRVTPAVFVVRAMALGKIDVSYVDQWVSVSEYPLSANPGAYHEFDDKWDSIEPMCSHKSPGMGKGKLNPY